MEHKSSNHQRNEYLRAAGLSVIGGAAAGGAGVATNHYLLKPEIKRIAARNAAAEIGQVVPETGGQAAKEIAIRLGKRVSGVSNSAYESAKNAWIKGLAGAKKITGKFFSEKKPLNALVELDARLNQVFFNDHDELTRTGVPLAAGAAIGVGGYYGYQRYKNRSTAVPPVPNVTAPEATAPVAPKVTIHPPPSTTAPSAAAVSPRYNNSANRYTRNSDFIPQQPSSAVGSYQNAYSNPNRYAGYADTTGSPLARTAGADGVLSRMKTREKIAAAGVVPEEMAKVNDSLRHRAGWGANPAVKQITKPSLVSRSIKAAQKLRK